MHFLWIVTIALVVIAILVGVLLWIFFINTTTDGVTTFSEQIDESFFIPVPPISFDVQEKLNDRFQKRLQTTTVYPTVRRFNMSLLANQNDPFLFTLVSRISNSSMCIDSPLPPANFKGRYLSTFVITQVRVQQSPDSLITLEKEWECTNDDSFLHSSSICLIDGFEDLRLFRWNQKMYAIAVGHSSRCIPQMHLLSFGYADQNDRNTTIEQQNELETKIVKVERLWSPELSSITQKNWGPLVFFDNAIQKEKLLWIVRVSPHTIYKLDETEIDDEFLKGAKENHERQDGKSILRYKTRVSKEYEMKWPTEARKWCPFLDRLRGGRPIVAWDSRHTLAMCHYQKRNSRGTQYELLFYVFESQPPFSPVAIGDSFAFEHVRNVRYCYPHHAVYFSPTDCVLVSLGLSDCDAVLFAISRDKIAASLHWVSNTFAV